MVVFKIRKRANSQLLLRKVYARQNKLHLAWSQKTGVCGQRQRNGVLALTLGFLIISGLCGNLLVTIVILRFERLRRHLNSYLILNLAISDFLTTSISMPYELATVLDQSIISHNGVLCKVGGILSYPFYISSTVTLVMLATERHIAVSDPLRYVSRVTTRTISIMIAFAWFQAVFFGILFAILGKVEFSKKSLDCGVTWEGTPLWLSLLALIMNVVLPYFLLLIMSLRVLTIARRQVRRIAFEMSAQTRPFRRRRNVFSISESKATAAILVAIIVFLILWIPFLITRGLMAFNDVYIPPVVNTSAVWILHLNSVVNVLIYTLRRSDYRQAFKDVMRCTSLSGPNVFELSVTNRTDKRILNLRRASAVKFKSASEMDNSAPVNPARSS
ncbi:trace amine-associated receptor 7h-like [Montipora capricornis]|uniref:trace amine-associated receptor 7h-like n=1 Tax=Montipora capricornis TaxID=246305 RepID=UPI0035F10CBC